MLDSVRSLVNMSLVGVDLEANEIPCWPWSSKTQGAYLPFHICKTRVFKNPLDSSHAHSV